VKIDLTMPFEIEKTTGLWPGWKLKFDAPALPKARAKSYDMSFHTESLDETTMWVNALQNYAKK